MLIGDTFKKFTCYNTLYDVGIEHAWTAAISNPEIYGINEYELAVLIKSPCEESADKTSPSYLLNISTSFVVLYGCFLHGDPRVELNRMLHHFIYMKTRHFDITSRAHLTS